jgi:hypothetical protein
MKNIDWKEAEKIASSYNDYNKVTAIFFVDQICDVCNEFVKVGMKELEERFEDDYQVFTVDNTDGMLFPPCDYPTGYIYVPNCPNVMPLRRVGGAPMELVEKDVMRQIESMKTGVDLDILRNAGR